MCDEKDDEIIGEPEENPGEEPDEEDPGNEESEQPDEGEPGESEQPEEPPEEEPPPGGPIIDDEMTLFYSKRTGDIKNFVTGESDMGFYGDDEPDFAEIWDYVILPRDDYVLNNFLQFKIEDGKPKLKNGINIGKYI